MSPPLLTAASQMMCPHGGTVTAAPSATKAIIDAPVLTMNDSFVVAGCAFTLPGPSPSPCVSVQWSGPSSHVTHGGAPALTAASTGLCLAATQAPQGTVIVSTTQPKVQGA
jgi:hypothetical protein